MREVSTTRRTDAPASKPAPAPAPAPASASGKEHVSTSREESKPASFSEAKAKREQRLGSRGPSSSLRSSPAPPSAIEGTSPKPSRAAGGSSTATELREDEETKAVRRIPVPTSALALETAFASVARTPHARLELLKVRRRLSTHAHQLMSSFLCSVSSLRACQRSLARRSRPRRSRPCSRRSLQPRAQRTRRTQPASPST